jgi:hypothetical protein
VPNPFRIHGAVSGPYFTDRAAELKVIVRALTEPSAKLLVFGERRVGKTSTLLAAIARVQARKGHALLVDLSTASTVADVAARVLEGASRGLGRGWKDLAETVVRHVKATVTVRPDPATGLLIPSFQVEARRADVGEQQRTLGQVLDAIEALAARKRTTVGIVLDEVQELHALGGEQAEWHLRGVIQHHQHIAYVLAGSRPSVLKEMIGEGRAFFGMLDTMAFGPIEPEHLATWIDARLGAARVSGRGTGAACVALAGPRTRDVVQLARKVYDVATAGGGKKRRVETAVVANAFSELIDEMDDALRAQWDDASSVQRDVLRAVAAARTGLTTEAARTTFGLPASGSVAKAAATLIEERRLVRNDTAPTGYAFDNPYFRGWVIRNALGDTGLRVSETSPPWGFPGANGVIP